MKPACQGALPRRALAAARGSLLILLTLTGSASSALASRHESGGFSYELAPTPGFVKPIEVPAADTWVTDASGGARSWLNETQHDLRNDTELLYRRKVDEALNSEGVRQLAQPSIDFDPSYQQLRLHQIAVERDGQLQDRFDPAAVTLAQRELEADASGIHTGVVTAMLVLDDVRVGDRVHLAWSVEGRHPVLGALGGEDYLLAWQWPLRHRYIRLLVDSDAPVHLRVPPDHPAPSTGDGEITLALHDLPAHEIESLLPRGVLPVPMLEYSPVSGWGAVADWASELFAPAAVPEELRALAQRIAAEHDQPEARALAALRFVQDELRYLSLSLGESTHRPAEPALVLQRRFGDCKDKSRLLVELLALLDIQAWPALVHSSLGASLPERLPRARAFDHAIVQMQIGERVYWVDPTMALQGGNLDTQGFPDFAHALVIRRGETALSAMLRPTEAVDRYALDEHFVTDQRGAELKLVQTWQGAYAEWLRRRLAAEGTRMVRDELRTRYGLIYGELDPLSELAVNDDREANLLQLSDHLQLRDFLVQDPERDGSISFQVQADLIDQILPLPTEVRRRQPLGLPHPLSVQHQVRVELAEDLLPARDVDQVLVQDPYFRYERQAQRRMNHFEASFEAVTLADRTDPADIERHLAHRRDMHRTLGLSVRVQRAGDRADSREERMRRLLDQSR